MENPKLCILLASYNGEKYIGDQLDSIINQTYKNWELIIRDDGSKAKTMIIYAVIGLAVAILAYTIVNFIVGASSGKGVNGGSSSKNSSSSNESSNSEELNSPDETSKHSTKPDNQSGSNTIKSQSGKKNGENSSGRNSSSSNNLNNN